MTEKMTLVGIRMPEKLKKKLSKQAKEEGLFLSTYIRMLAVKHLKVKGK